ncbi:glutamate racemase [Candidatus Kapabacteria bacterium]|nr:glutamate racemase [Candidatus Kapabacteria bacterium]
MSKIGVFDSGIGGLTVLSQLINRLPGHDFVYFGDNARVPYGNKSERVIQHYSLQATKFLLSHNVDMIVVACNTASALAINQIKEMASGLPVIGMINSSVSDAIKITTNGNIAVIGTESTIASGAYQNKFSMSNIKVTTKSCPLFVPFVEAGMISHPALDLIIDEYLNFLKDEDTLILGCTHYPFLKTSIKKYLPEINIVDTGESAAKLAAQLLGPNNGIGITEYFVSDTPNNFINIAENELGLKITNLQQLNIEEW